MSYPFPPPEVEVIKEIQERRYRILDDDPLLTRRIGVRTSRKSSTYAGSSAICRRSSNTLSSYSATVLQCAFARSGTARSNNLEPTADSLPSSVLISG